MKADAECLKCLVDQAWRAAGLTGCTAAQREELLRRAGAMAATADLTLNPAALSQPLYGDLAQITGRNDPYLAIKQEANRQALEALPMVRRAVEAHPDPLRAAIHAAVGGNLMDSGVGTVFDFGRDLDALLHTPLVRDATGEFRALLHPGARLLYVADNAGEIVFDRILVEQLLKLGVLVTLAVKAAPIINDALMADAAGAGLTDLVPVITTGAGDIGVNFANASGEFLRHFRESDIQLLKGQGNYESCESEAPRGFFLLKAKCAVVADSLRVRLGDSVFVHQCSP
jgi:hypothetical protein